jgi:anti-anti-sigma regulatory factor
VTSRAGHSTGTSTSASIVVRLSGRLEATGSSRLSSALAALAEIEGVDVVVDLAAVPSIDEQAARALVRARAAAEVHHSRLVLEHVRAQPRELLARCAGSAVA